MTPDPMHDEQGTAWDRAMAEHERQLVVGARVRITPGEGCSWHGEQEAGLTGVIIHVDAPSCPAVAPGHRFVVLFDRPLWITRSRIAAWDYCAGELTPIPWRTPEEVVADTLRVLGAADPGEGED